ncbi:uncharacterized protein LOC124278248 [Haliotis rubra]|uniref:uncharacterized protein LOC124278248 n=1 Tax=Haliotis rubra TaxID=36100 RepID=UPI001EE53B38|nr:uncharacterized protein LOC124278248 [Haliotis rubra]
MGDHHRSCPGSNPSEDGPGRGTGCGGCTLLDRDGAPGVVVAPYWTGTGHRVWWLHPTGSGRGTGCGGCTPLARDETPGEVVAPYWTGTGHRVRWLHPTGPGRGTGCSGCTLLDRDGAPGVVVAPYWPTKVWFPMLIRLLIEDPLILPRGESLLRLVQQPAEIHLMHRALQLMVCHLSGNPCARDTYLGTLEKSASVGGKAHLTRWEIYCDSRQINLFTLCLEDGINFLADLAYDGLGYSAVNTARSALSSVISLPDGVSFGEHFLVKKLLKGVFEMKPSLPRHGLIWDVDIVLNHHHFESPAVKLGLKELTLKTVMLLALLTGQRCQTFHSLEINSMQTSASTCVFHVNARTNTFSKNNKKSVETTTPKFCDFMLSSVKPKH